MSLSVYAAFSPLPDKRADFLEELLSDLLPKAVQALLNGFPFLCLANHLLQSLSWSEQADPWLTFLWLTAVTGCFVYWDFVRTYLIPHCLVLWFVIIVWQVQTVLDDPEPPTMDEMVDVLNNVVSQAKYCFAPLKHIKISVKSVAALVTITPLWIMGVKLGFPPRYVLLLVILFGATFHSKEAVATRRLLWRGVYIRMLVFYLTGFEQAPEAALHPQGRGHGSMPGFRILNKSNISFSQEGQLIEFAILEHQRRWILAGWSSRLLPYERASYTTETLIPSTSPESFTFPTFDATATEYRWKWLEEKWRTDATFNHGGVGDDGWCYYDGNWKGPAADDGMTKYTRTRKWVRRALLVIDKP